MRTEEMGDCEKVPNSLIIGVYHSAFVCWLAVKNENRICKGIRPSVAEKGKYQSGAQKRHNNDRTVHKVATGGKGWDCVGVPVWPACLAGQELSYLAWFNPAWTWSGILILAPVHQLSGRFLSLSGVLELAKACLDLLFCHKLKRQGRKRH